MGYHNLLLTELLQKNKIASVVVLNIVTVRQKLFFLNPWYLLPFSIVCEFCTYLTNERKKCDLKFFYIFFYSS